MFVRNFGRGPLWLPVVVKELTGPVSYTVEQEDDRVVHRHVDHVRGRTSPDHMPPTLLSWRMIESYTDMLIMYEAEHHQTTCLRGLGHQMRFLQLSSQL